MVEKNVEFVMKRAQADQTVLKGLISYLNWQDKMAGRITTPRPENTQPAKNLQQPVTRVVQTPISPVR